MTFPVSAVTTHQLGTTVEVPAQALSTLAQPEPEPCQDLQRAPPMWGPAVQGGEDPRRGLVRINPSHVISHCPSCKNMLFRVIPEFGLHSSASFPSNKFSFKKTPSSPVPMQTLIFLECDRLNKNNKIISSSIQTTPASPPHCKSSFICPKSPTYCQSAMHNLCYLHPC